MFKILCSWIWRKEWWIACMRNVSYYTIALKKKESRTLYNSIFFYVFLLSFLPWFFKLVLTYSFCISIGTPCITDCVMAELEKLGQKYRVALRHVLLFFITFKFFISDHNLIDPYKHVVVWNHVRLFSEFIPILPYYYSNVLTNMLKAVIFLKFIVNFDIWYPC